MKLTTHSGSPHSRSSRQESINYPAREPDAVDAPPTRAAEMMRLSPVARLEIANSLPQTQASQQPRLTTDELRALTPQQRLAALDGADPLAMLRHRGGQ